MQGQGSRVLLRPYILVKRSTRLRRLHAGLTPLPLSLSSDDRLTFRHETCVPGVLAAPCCRPTHRPSSRARRRGPPRARAKLKPYKPRNMKYPDYAYGKPQNNAWVRLNYYLCRGLAPHTRRSPSPPRGGFAPHTPDPLRASSEPPQTGIRASQAANHRKRASGPHQGPITSAARRARPAPPARRCTRLARRPSARAAAWPHRGAAP